MNRQSPSSLTTKALQTAAALGISTGIVVAGCSSGEATTGYAFTGRTPGKEAEFEQEDGKAGRISY